jgi:hypothetical protein
VNELAERTTQNIFPRCNNTWIEREILVQADRETRRFRCSLKGVTACIRQRRWFFDQNMGSPVKSTHGHGLVSVRRCENVDDLRLCLVIELIRMTEVAWNSKAGGECFGSPRIGIQDACQADILQPVQCSGMCRGGPTGPYDADTLYNCHGVLPQGCRRSRKGAGSPI